jgi:hypothetical protein
MSAVKISVSLEEQQLRWLRRQAKTLGTTVSALMAEAVADLRRARERERLLERLGGRVRINDREAVELRRAWDAD